MLVDDLPRARRVAFLHQLGGGVLVQSLAQALGRAPGRRQNFVHAPFIHHGLVAFVIHRRGRNHLRLFDRPAALLHPAPHLRRARRSVLLHGRHHLAQHAQQFRARRVRAQRLGRELLDQLVHGLLV